VANFKLEISRGHPAGAKSLNEKLLMGTVIPEALLKTCRQANSSASTAHKQRG